MGLSWTVAPPAIAIGLVVTDISDMGVDARDALLRRHPIRSMVSVSSPCL